jgi:hypothetical protein
VNKWQPIHPTWAPTGSGVAARNRGLDARRLRRELASRTSSGRAAFDPQKIAVTRLRWSAVSGGSLGAARRSQTRRSFTTAHNVGSQNGPKATAGHVDDRDRHAVLSCGHAAYRSGKTFSVGVYDSLQTVPSRTAMQVTHPDTAVDVLTRAGRWRHPAVLCASRTHGECAGGST